MTAEEIRDLAKVLLEDRECGVLNSPTHVYRAATLLRVLAGIAKRCEARFTSRVNRDVAKAAINNERAAIAALIDAVQP